MIIGIDGSRAFIKNRTGIEEYSYRVIKNLRNNLSSEQIVLYVRKKQEIDFEIPKNWEIKIIKFSRFWTQVGLSLEMLLHPVDVLFVPAHTVPIIHPRNTIVTIHGLEYEFCPKAYSSWERFYMRLSIKASCKWAKKIISVSQNTKFDLEKLYGVVGDKIEVIYEGYENQEPIINNQELKSGSKFFLFVGRIEERKNVANIVKAFEILKEKYQVAHKLLLAGRPGYGYEKIKLQIENSKYREDIAELGYVSDEEKFGLMKNADAFVFPTLYEGFGIPVLEAQSVGCPVIAGRNSSIPEVVGDSVVLVDVRDQEAIAKAMALLISDRSLRSEYVQKGLENVKRFSWSKCAERIAEILG